MRGKEIRLYFIIVLIIRLKKISRTKEVDHVARVGEKRNEHKI
jgi:hypothetical protein